MYNLSFVSLHLILIFKHHSHDSLVLFNILNSSSLQWELAERRTTLYKLVIINLVIWFCIRDLVIKLSVQTVAGVLLRAYTKVNLG